MRAIVTGAKGFIGGKVCDALRANGVDVVGIGTGDKIPVSGRFDVMYHFAWHGSSGPMRADSSVQLENVQMSMSYYLSACALGCQRFVCAGTVSENLVKEPEHMTAKSQNMMYAIAKRCLYAMLKAAAKPPCSLVWAELGNIYGVQDGRGTIVSYTIGKLANNEVAEFGPANQPYDFVFEDDLIEALVLLGTVKSLSRDRYHIGSGHPMVLSEFIREIGLIAGRSDLIRIGARPDDGARYEYDWFDISPLREDTGYESKVAFSEGVSRACRKAGL